MVSRRGLAGRLIPNPVITLDGRAGRLDDVTGCRFLVVTSDPRSPAVARIAGHLDAVTLDVAGPGVGDSGLRRWLGHAAAAVVRPDRAVLAAESLRDLERTVAALDSGSART